MAIILAGDTHGSLDLDKVTEYFEYNEDFTKEDYLIILGDAGILWNEVEDSDIQNILNDLPVTTLWINGLTFFTFGGGNSIDKASRRIGLSWWPKEMPSYYEYEEGMQNLEKVDWKVDYKEWYFGHWHMDESIENFRCLYHEMVELEDI